MGTQANTASISWTYNLSRNTHLALLNDYVDITLTYDRSLEAIAANEGWSTTVACAFHDHFVLAGPVQDPLNLHSTPTIEEALKAIVNAGRRGRALWQARSDRSATMAKEHSLWERVSLQPWDNAVDKNTWYSTNLKTPADALVVADAAGAYHLTDRSTLLRQTATRTIKNTTVFFEPTSKTDMLLNSCWACHASRTPSKEVERNVQLFLKWLLGEYGQEVVRAFGEAEAGLPFFAKVSDGYCPQLLRGGRPSDGKWMHGL